MGFDQPYSVAVEGLVFDADLNWILMRRGKQASDEVGKLEGIGGRVEDPLACLRDELRREIVEEVGPEADIEILEFLEVKSDRVRKVDSRGRETFKTWVIVSFACLHRSGGLLIQEPEKNEGFEYVQDLKVAPERLSSSCRQSLVMLQKAWPRISTRIKRELTVNSPA
ncbi:NUDIX domain-containing protein [Thermopolyspora sp. NPDC052614]|uniref:NUDIX hydrolase n=1 Tax=Thermopolyspora sp. NPDC052614 TaxID=3155682 RepID=UPI003446332B